MCVCVFDKCEGTMKESALNIEVGSNSKCSRKKTWSNGNNNVSNNGNNRKRLSLVVLEQQASDRRVDKMN